MMFRDKVVSTLESTQTRSANITGEGWEVSLRTGTGSWWEWKLYRDGKQVQSGTSYYGHAAAVTQATESKNYILKMEEEMAKPKVVRI